MAMLPLEAHFERMQHCHATWRGWAVPAATPANHRYPMIYPRDTASICRAYDELALAGALSRERAAAPMAGAAAFMMETQAEDGAWTQRYDLNARDRSLYPQEDNIGHGIQIVARHVLQERRAGRPMDEGPALDCIGRALEGARKLWSDKHGLFWSTTSIHESAVESGWTLWTNAVFHEALRLALEVQEKAEWQDMLDRLEQGISGTLVRDGQFVRRIDPKGEPDLRPDITLLSPSRYCLEHLDPQASAGAVQRVQDELADPASGLLRRHLPDWEDEDVHMHGGDGPYLSFSAWLAQHQASHGDGAGARRTLERIASFSTDEGLPEHAASSEDFAQFVQREVVTGRDLRKEFDPKILLDSVTWQDQLEEAARMLKAYAKSSSEDDVVRTASPHAWTHAECALATAWLSQ